MTFIIQIRQTVFAWNFTNVVFLCCIYSTEMTWNLIHGLTRGFACWIFSHMVPGWNPDEIQCITCSCNVIIVSLRIIYFLLGKKFCMTTDFVEHNLKKELHVHNWGTIHTYFSDMFVISKLNFKCLTSVVH